MNTRDTVIIRLARRFEDYWPQLFVSIGTVVMAAAALPSPSQGSSSWKELVFYKNNLLFFAGALLLFLGNIFMWRRTPGIRSLQTRVSELEDIIEQSKDDYFQLIENHLAILANDKLKISDTERVSVYKFEEGAFVMLGRYSKNPEYCKRGRGRYPANEGIIAKAWQNGEAFVANLPDPRTEEERYLDEMKNTFGINKSTARNFKMKSRCYYGFAIENAEQQRIAVVIIESVNPGGLVKDEIKRTLVNGEAKAIGNFLKKMRRLEPSPSLAKREGY